MSFTYDRIVVNYRKSSHYTVNFIPTRPFKYFKFSFDIFCILLKTENKINQLWKKRINQQSYEISKMRSNINLVYYRV